MSIIIREAVTADEEAVLRITRPLVQSASYAFAPDADDETLKAYWLSDQVHTYVAELDSKIVGCFILRPNMPGPGGHVANGSYAVHPDSRGLGLGRAMGERSLQLARSLGFLAMQFNAVVQTNEAALSLWRSLGFTIVGTVPEAFKLPSGELVSLHIMHRAL